MRKVVVGIGNPYIPEDSVGIRIAAKAMKMGYETIFAFPAEVPELISEYDFAIIVDSLTGDGCEVHLFGVEDLGVRRVFTSHSMGLIESILLGLEYTDMPEILIIAVETGGCVGRSDEKVDRIVLDIIAYEMCRA